VLCTIGTALGTAAALVVYGGGVATLGCIAWILAAARDPMEHRQRKDSI
jgi:hypothetical protein